MVSVVLAGVFNFASGVSGKLHTPYRYADLITGSPAQHEGGCGKDSIDPLYMASRGALIPHQHTLP